MKLILKTHRSMKKIKSALFVELQKKKNLCFTCVEQSEVM